MSNRSHARRSILGLALALTVGLAGGALLLAACGDGGKRPATAAAAPREVRVATAERALVPDVVTVSGTLAAEEQVVLGMKVAGRLQDLLVDLGSRAAKGQPLARLAPTDFELRVKQAEAALAQARSRLGMRDTPREGSGAEPGGDPPVADRVDPENTSVVRQAAAVRQDALARRDRARALFAQGLLPRADLDTAEAAFQVADSQHEDARDEVVNREGVLAQRRSELDLARQQLADSVLLAPFDGAVRERQASPGQYVSAGQPVVTFVRVHPLRLKLAVPERAAAKVRQGQEVRVHVDGDAAVHRGTVARLSPAIEESNRTLMIEAEVPNADGALRPGSFASAEIVTAADRPVVLVPKSSIVTFAGIEKVLVVEDGSASSAGGGTPATAGGSRVKETRVTTGRVLGEKIEIVEGLDAGARIVAEPGNLVSGDAVTVIGTP